MKRFLSVILGLCLVGCAVVKVQPPLPPTPPTPQPKAYALAVKATANTPVVLRGLTNILTLQGQSVTFSVVASNTTYYRWQIPGRPAVIGTNTYTITNVQPANMGVVAVYLSTSTKSNKAMVVFSSAYLSVGTTNILADCLPSGECSVILGWCLSKDTNVTSYSLYYGSGATTNWVASIYDTNYPCGPVLTEGTNWCRCYTNTTAIGNTNTATVNGLLPGVTYYFALTGSDSAGAQSDFSNEAQYTTPLHPTPTNVVVKLATVGANLVQFSAKVCPDSLITIQAKDDLRAQWSVMATNLTPDSYGNFFYNHVANMPQRFFRLKLQ